MPGGLDAEIEKLRQNLNGLPQPQVELPFIVVSGLAGTGKSVFLP
jgi:GTP1/Obg family GTP-binding protein